MTRTAAQIRAGFGHVAPGGDLDILLTALDAESKRADDAERYALRLREEALESQTASIDALNQWTQCAQERDEARADVVLLTAERDRWEGEAGTYAAQALKQAEEVERLRVAGDRLLTRARRVLQRDADRPQCEHECAHRFCLLSLALDGAEAAGFRHAEDEG